MQDKCFLDTNVLLYLLSNDERKEIAKKLLKSEHTISIQVLNEFSNVSIGKLKFSIDKTKEFIDIISNEVIIEIYTKKTILNALDLKKDYNLQFYDALIVATAVESNCNILYSEDMQDGLVINNEIKILNPFNLTNEA